MNYGDAMAALYNGRTVRRKCWRKDIRLRMVDRAPALTVNGDTTTPCSMADGYCRDHLGGYSDPEEIERELHEEHTATDWEITVVA